MVKIAHGWNNKKRFVKMRGSHLLAVSHETLKDAFIREVSKVCPDPEVSGYVKSLSPCEKFAYDIIKEILAEYLVCRQYGLNEEGCFDDSSIWYSIVNEDVANEALNQARRFRRLCESEGHAYQEFLDCLSLDFYSRSLQVLWLDLQYGKSEAVTSVFKENNCFGLKDGKFYSWPKLDGYSLEEILQFDLSKN